MKESATFSNHQTLFLGRIRVPLPSEHKLPLEPFKSLNKSQSPDSSHLNTYQTSPKSSKKSPKYKDFFQYSCFSNPQSTKIYLNSRCLSGNLLNRSLMKGDINNKIISEGNFFEFDKVLSVEMKYNTNNINFI